MNTQPALRTLALVLLTVPLLLVGACSDDDCPTCPGDQANPAPTMANVWPSADGSTWIHDVAVQAYEGDPADVVDPDDPEPPLPSMEELYADLSMPIETEPLGASEGLYRLRFDGEVTTESGVTAPRLREELFDPASAKTLLPPHEQRLRDLVLAARPDLRPAGWPNKAAGDDLEAPLLMGGYAFDATDTGIYSFGDLNQQHSWIYLEGDLAVGDEFSIQLVPDLADDIFLYGRIWSVGDRTVGDTAYANCVECFYVVDMGVHVVSDENGNLLGQTRPYIYGTVLYAPGAGPVACHQRSKLMNDGILGDDGAVIFENKTTISGLEVAAP